MAAEDGKLTVMSAEDDLTGWTVVVSRKGHGKPPVSAPIDLLSAKVPIVEPVYTCVLEIPFNIKGGAKANRGIKGAAMANRRCARKLSQARKGGVAAFGGSLGYFTYGTYGDGDIQYY